MLGSCAHRERGKCGSIILRVSPFPRTQIELKPGPRTRLIARRLLQRPHVVQCGSRNFTESAGLSVMACKNQGVEDGFGSAGLGGFVSTVAIVRSDFFPKAYTLRDVVQE